MRTVFPAVRDHIRRGERVVLCGVIASSGSTPRGAGARMAVFADGGFAGTIGGGSVERLAQNYARTLLEEGRPAVRTFQLHPNGTEDIGMICGGTVTVVFQPLGKEDLPLMERICALLEAERPAWLVTALSEHGPWTMALWEKDTPWQMAASPEAVRPLMGSRAVLQWGEPALFVEPLTRQGTVYIFGAGHVGRELAWLLDRVGFRLALFDDRMEALEAEQFPTGVQLIQGDFGRIDLPLTESDYVVIMTAGHQGDLAILQQLLTAPVTYIGCIGSRKKAAFAREYLKQNGFTEADIKRIHSPIGLPIGGETPQEIAVSIAAELIAHRAGKELRYG